VLVRGTIPNLFLFVCGALGKQSIGIGRAAIFSGLKDSLTLSYYEFAGELDAETMQKAVRDLKKSLTSGMPCMPMMYRPDSDGLEIRTDHDDSSASTVLTVSGRDQIGFCFRLANVFSDLKLQLMNAEISTAGVSVTTRFSLVLPNTAKLGEEDCALLKEKIVRSFKV
jgi:UTP:GlnB (protein PII) uridylyltransferase